MKSKKFKKKKLEFDFCPVKDIITKNKRGFEVGNIKFISSKKSYKKYRNIIVKELGIKRLLFEKKKKD